MIKKVKSHVLPISVTSLSVLGGIYMEPYIPKNELGLVLLTMAVTVSAILWKKLKNKFPIFIMSLAAFIFHFFRGRILAKQMALTILIAGCMIVIFHVLGLGGSRNKD